MLYAIPMIDSQKPMLDKYCFGICGKLSLNGAIKIEVAGGYCWICLHKECVYEKGHTSPPVRGRGLKRLSISEVKN